MQDVSLILIGEKINYLICQAPPPRLLFIRLFNSFSDLFFIETCVFKVDLQENWMLKTTTFFIDCLRIGLC